MRDLAREVTAHHTIGLDDLTDALVIRSDAPDDANGSGTHHYNVTHRDDPAFAPLAEIQFQHGPRNVEGSTTGITAQALVTILIDHFESFQNGPFKSRDNALVITALEEAKGWMIKRVIDRKRRGVLGQLSK